MSYPSQDLEDCSPYFLEKLGFRERRQAAGSVLQSAEYADYCRLAEWVLPISTENDTAIELVVLYELSVSDEPLVPTSENFNYYFIEVALKGRSPQAIAGREYDFVEWGLLWRMPLRIRTKAQLRSLLKMLNGSQSRQNA